uniref:Uncharacterized protein n=1 Tax=Hippocampus comes TaxID=109280 RepID=A0A3Q2XZA3_HIPCM
SPWTNVLHISVVWPPQTDSPKRSFTIEEELKLMKPLWPPAEAAVQEKEVTPIAPHSVLRARPWRDEPLSFNAPSFLFLFSAVLAQMSCTWCAL